MNTSRKSFLLAIATCFVFSFVALPATTEAVYGTAPVVVTSGNQAVTLQLIEQQLKILLELVATLQKQLDEINNNKSPDVIASAVLQDNTEDYAGLWKNFGPGTGNMNKNPVDWKWSMKLTFNVTPKWVQRITIVHNTRGEVWSTGYSSTLSNGADLYGYNENPYPLVVRAEKAGEGSGFWYQINNSYDQNLFIGADANTAYLGVPNTFTLYAQPESRYFTGGVLIVEFTDGTFVKSSIPSSSNFF